jgi:hypothetical protein
MESVTDDLLSIIYVDFACSKETDRLSLSEIESDRG